jgi:hypothetical protein
MLNINKNIAATTTEGLAGVSQYNDMVMPIITAKPPIPLAKKSICSGVCAKFLAIAGGITSMEVMSKIPTIFIAIMLEK